MRFFYHWLLSILLLVYLLAIAPALTAAESVKPRRSEPSLVRTSTLYKLCTSQYEGERGLCDGFITGVASTLLDSQVGHIRVCIPLGTSSDEIVRKVVKYLREKADADDMKVSAVNFLAPLLAILYNCTPGQVPPSLAVKNCGA